MDPLSCAASVGVPELVVSTPAPPAPPPPSPGITITGGGGGGAVNLVNMILIPSMTASKKTHRTPPISPRSRPYAGCNLALAVRARDDRIHGSSFRAPPPARNQTPKTILPTPRTTLRSSAPLDESPRTLRSSRGLAAELYALDEVHDAAAHRAHGERPADVIEDSVRARFASVVHRRHRSRVAVTTDARVSRPKLRDASRGTGPGRKDWDAFRRARERERANGRWRGRENGGDVGRGRGCAGGVHERGEKGAQSGGEAEQKATGSAGTGGDRGWDGGDEAQGYAKAKEAFERAEELCAKSSVKAEGKPKAPKAAKEGGEKASKAAAVKVEKSALEATHLPSPGSEGHVTAKSKDNLPPGAKITR